MAKRALLASEIGALAERAHSDAIALDELLNAERMPPRRALTSLSLRVREALLVLEREVDRAAIDQWSDDASSWSSSPLCRSSRKV